MMSDDDIGRIADALEKLVSVNSKKSPQFKEIMGVHQFYANEIELAINGSMDAFGVAKHLRFLHNNALNTIQQLREML
jgi:hypothetical protein